MTEMKELLPCPFCGGEASCGTIKYSQETLQRQGWGQDTFHTVNCVSCGAQTERIVGAKTQDHAVRRWNTRATSLDPLREALEGIYDTRPKAGYLYDSRAHQEVIKIAREALGIHPFAGTTMEFTSPTVADRD